MTHEPHTRKNSQPMFYKSGILRSKLQRTYGYFVDKSQWTQLSELFTDDATLEIESTLGAGSRFRCRFPRARILPRDAAAPVTIAPP